MSLVDYLLNTYPHVHILDSKRADVNETIRALVEDGRDMLHVVSDFDFTLTKYEKNGEKLPSTFAVIENTDKIILPDGTLLRDQANILREKYHPIEYDVNIRDAEKIPLMIEWWLAAQSLILKSNLNQSIVREFVRDSKLEFRDGVHEFIRQLLNNKIPILIFSAGLGDVIKHFFEKEIPEFKYSHEGSHIVSNFIQYDKNGNLASFSKKLIHSFNKNEHEVIDTDYFRSVSHRPNVILLGDTLGDAEMTNGMEHLKKILKIGFLNRSTPQKVEVYQRLYDIVICDDSTFNIPNVILGKIKN